MSWRRRLPYDLSLTPLAVAAILITTAVPLDFSGAAGWSLRLNVSDFLQNLLLYAPLGVALRRYPAWKVGVIAAALSLVIEASQLWVIARFASPFDVVSNALGAVVALRMARRVARGRWSGPVMLRVTPARLLLGVVAIVAVLAAWTRPMRPASLANWDLAYPMLVGNERTSNRPWRGTVSSIRLFSTASPRKEIAPGTREGAVGADAPAASLLYERAEPLVADGGPAIQLPAEASSEFGVAAVANNAFTVMLDLATDDLDQDGPARILSFSGDTSHRNFDIGQVGRRLVLRVRTPMNGLNGERHRVTSTNVLAAGRELRVAATYDGEVARLFVDGILVGRGNMAAAGCDSSAMCDWAAPLLWALVGAVLAALALALAPARSPRSVGYSVVAACIAAVLLGRLLPITPLATGPLGAFPWLSLLGAAGVGAARLAASTQGQPAGDSAPPRPAT